MAQGAPVKITTRTPPVRIAAADMLAIAAMPPEVSGLLLRWGMRHYADGSGVPIDEARREARMDDRSWAMLLDVAKAMLDTEAMDAGFVVVTAFHRAADRLAAVSASRVRTAVPRSVAVGGATVRNHRRSEAAPSGVQKTDAPAPRAAAPPSDPDEWTAIAAALVGRGANPSEVGEAVEGWRQRHPIEEVMTAVHNIAERRISKPVRYIQTMLDNALAARRASMPSAVRIANAGPMMPRPVKRRIQVGPRSGWTFEGWTARGHPRGGPTVADRQEVWRNEAGTLSYKRSDPDRPTPVPNYDEDAGLYETD